MRTVFERSTIPRRIPIGLAVLTVLSLAGGVAMLTLPDAVESALVGGFMVLVGVLTGAVLLFVLRGLRRAYRLEFADNGVLLELSGKTLEIPWTGIESWDLAEHRMRGRNPPRIGLRAFPAEHVDDPTAGGLGLIWSAEDGCWVLCEPDSTDGSPDEIVAAARKFAMDKERRPQAPMPE